MSAERVKRAKGRVDVEVRMVIVLLLLLLSSLLL